MMRTRLPPGASIDLPGGGRLSFEVSQGAVIQDPQGGPPLEVEPGPPDAMAVYFLGTAIVECTRMLERHSQTTKRATRVQKIVNIMLAAVLAASLANLGYHLW